MAQLQRLAIAPFQFRDGQIILTVEQQHYLLRVLRLRKGDRFIAIDARGQWWLAQLEDASSAQIKEPIDAKTELPVEVTLIVALPKGSGFDEVVRQTTELGVTMIVPALSQRTLIKPSPQKLARWQRIATEAAEQSERQIVPVILEPVPFSTILSSLSQEVSQEANMQFICVARGESNHLLTCLQEKKLANIDGKKNIKIIIATGPEGGWTPAEIEHARAARFQPVSLGRRILRAVTAPVVAMSLIAAVWESNNFIETF
ncbi:MAG: 16S rRNA (uracil(1498)-N(3))-methyltransferase [Oscillatoriaceae bacterium SKW80]|nr:16S rRNA (uracil(1498)-N(3))-methyltransferase [Oscillatoriaceae bacterium SKYG93]MCX8120431.1 16S rRNA (uracil(1498)-N(3))-methyltransferase [Oscillatoriaceae bacterium SKW80]MDW8452994.1 16S rRNA (uracil(1498)-N(3))-methyltransferase [Oscillatoriaceae cyanobacterium SKYGB_i_bin93]HIK28591.1 16S rRNA (uracil(1498)-N(3))-methyltransferase [Oscillatoriaceae cyanobacterium M7585_C2015_266]